MTVKDLVENIKHNGLLVSASLLEKLYTIAIENEKKLVAVTEQRDALVVENVGLKRIPKNDSVAMLLALDSFRSESLPDVGLQKAFETLMYHRETPATDAAIAALRAEVLPPNIAEIIDSGELESILFASEASYSEEYRMAFYNFHQLRESKGAQK